MVQLIDLKGAIVYQNNVPQGKVQLDLGQIPAGFYFVRTVAEGTTETQRLVIQK